MRPTEKQIEAAARAIIAAKAPTVANDDHWPDTVKHYREMCAKWPEYKAANSLITDSFREAEIALSAALAVEAGTILDATENTDVKASFLEDGYALTTSPASSGVEGEAVAKPYPQLLSDEEKKAILTDAENLWGDLQENKLGGFSGINRPFYILSEFKRVIEKYGNRDIGFTWSKDALDAASPAPTLPASSVKGEGNG